MGQRQPTWWNDALAFLRQDDLLGPVVEEHGPDGISSRDNLFQCLVRSIVGQQISVLAAAPRPCGSMQAAGLGAEASQPALARAAAPGCLLHRGPDIRPLARSA